MPTEMEINETYAQQCKDAYDAYWTRRTEADRRYRRAIEWAIHQRNRDLAARHPAVHVVPFDHSW